MKLTLSISIENASKDDLAAMTAALKAGGWHRLAAALESSKKVNELEGVSGPPVKGKDGLASFKKARTIFLGVRRER